jgi:hypothetical protein
MKLRHLDVVEERQRTISISIVPETPITCTHNNNKQAIDRANIQCILTFFKSAGYEPDEQHSVL